MIREINENDREIFLELADEFYHSEGVLHPIPEENHIKTFNEIISNSPYVSAYIIEYNSKAAGYGQLSFTYSNEAGGLVVWIEEVYIRPEYQNLGLGSEFFNTVLDMYREKAARIRLEIEPDNDNARKLYKRLGFKELGYESMILEN